MNERVIRLRLSPWMVQLISAALEKLPQNADSRLAIPQDCIPQDDEDLYDAWLHSLVEQTEADSACLRKTLARLRSNGIADLDREEAEAFLRAVTAVRLRLQAGPLADLPEGDLQCDAINIETLPEATQPLYACYLLLADIQKQIIAQIAQSEGIETTDDDDGFFILPEDDDADDSGHN